MTYRNLLELYKKGQLSEDDAARIRSDIDRQEAIAEYLCEAEEAFAIELPESLPEKDAEDFAKTIRRSIRQAFVKLCVVVLVLTLVLILFIQFALPKIVSSFYYDPTEIVENKGTDMEVSRMSRDMAVYSELALPGRFRDLVYASDLGYGNYEICIPQTVSFTKNFSSVSGKMEKGKLTLYNTNILREPYSNIFYWYDVHINDSGSSMTDKPLSSLLSKETTSWHAEASESQVSSMSGTGSSLAFVTLEKQMKYEDFIAWTQQQDLGRDIWCVPVNHSNRYSENLGFLYRPSASASAARGPENYPNLILWQTGMSEADEQAMLKNAKKESFMKKHYVSMLRYMADQKDFLNTSSAFSLNLNAHAYDEIADYIEENGLTIIGFAVPMTKETAQKLLQDDHVYGINIEELP